MVDIDFTKPATYFKPDVQYCRASITRDRVDDYRVVLDLPWVTDAKRGDWLTVEFIDNGRPTLVQGRIVFKRGRRVHVMGGVYDNQ